MCHARLEVRMESLSPFLWGSCIPYNMPVYPGARRKTPISLKWTAKLPGSLLGGNFTALPRIPLANLDIPEPKARQHAGKRLACIFVGDLQDAVLQCGCLKLALSFLAYLAFKIRIGRGEQSGVA